LGSPTPPFLLVGHREKDLFPCDSIILYVFRNVVAPGDNNNKCHFYNNNNGSSGRAAASAAYVYYHKNNL